jgi:hypothetical protein
VTQRPKGEIRQILRIKDVKIGFEFEFRGQQYACTGLRDYETMSGRWIELVEMESKCPECGSMFSLAASKRNIRQRFLTRRCSDCRRPGVPVDGRRRRATAMAAKPISKSKKPCQLQTHRTVQAPSEGRLLRHPRLAVKSVPPAAIAPSASARAGPPMLNETHMRALEILG